MAITAALVKELRERTGSGMMDCKKALMETDGNMEEAIDLMRASGAAKAAKKAGRIASEGLVNVTLSDDKKTAIILEVNSETDFVTKGDAFIGFVNTLGALALKNQPADIEVFLTQTLESGETVEKAREDIIAKVGENVSVRRVQTITTRDGVIGAYKHGERIAVVSVLSGNDADLAKDVAMHVAAASPQFVKPENVPAEVVEKEKEIQIEIAIQSGKPADIAEKMVAGRMKKFTGEVSLTGQPFVKDPSISVAELLKNNSADVINFVRFEVGEGIEKKTEDFAAEVAAQMAAAKK